MSNHKEYANKTNISYSSSSNIKYDNSLLSGGRDSLRNNRDYISGNTTGRNISKRSSGGAGKGRRMGGGAGIGKGKGMHAGGKGVRQALNIPKQFKEDQKNKIQSDNAGLAIDKIEQADSDIKTQKNPLDRIIEKLEEKSKKEQKKQHGKVLNEKE